jgi:hypothetical protein
VDNALHAFFGANSVKRGNKAFDIHANTYRTDADVIACFPFVRYQANGYSPQGTAFFTAGGLRITNWPDQNYDNGVTKNNETGRRFKDTVRILKNLRNEMASGNVASAKKIQSFTIECLVWNAPNEAFGHDTHTADVRWVLAHLFNNTMKDEQCSEWVEVNDLKYLFRGGQPCDRASAHQALSDMWDFLGFD